jgi:hypothetical protein
VLGICPSTFDTTHTINFLCILARDWQSIAASYFFFCLVGISLLHQQRFKIDHNFPLFHASEDSSIFSLRI